MTSKLIKISDLELTLKRDFLTFLDFDPFVESYEVQPIKLFCKDLNNKITKYTPYVLVCYCSRPNFSKPRIILYDVKYRKDLIKSWPFLKQKFQAAVSLAREEGWIFKIVTELEIRGPYLENIKFLKKYRKGIDDERLSIALDIMEKLGETNPKNLIATIASDFSNRAEVTYLVWQMLALGYIKADLRKPLTMVTRIWV